MMTLNQDVLYEKMRIHLRYLASVEIFSASQANKALSQCTNLLLVNVLGDSDKFKSFKCEDDRLDDFFFNTVSFTIHEELGSVLLLILVLRHG